MAKKDILQLLEDIPVLSIHRTFADSRKYLMFYGLDPDTDGTDIGKSWALPVRARGRD